MSETPIEPSLSPLELVQNLPSLLVSLLERRYLSEVRLGDWNFREDGHPSRPIVREVVTLSRSHDTDGAAPMTGVLSSWHEPGQTVLAILHGTRDAVLGHRHRLYYGARRMRGSAAADEYLASQEGGCAAHYPGLTLGPAAALSEVASLTDFLRSAPCIAAATGIPSAGNRMRDGGFERLTRSLGSREYAVLIVAEPLPITAADEAVDACRRLQSEVSAYTNRQLSRTRGGAESEDTTPSAPSVPADRLPSYLHQCSSYLRMCGLPLLGNLVTGGAMLMESDRQAPSPLRRRTETESWSDSASITLVDAVARACDELLAQHAARIRAGRGGGWWRAAVYLVAENQATLQTLARGLRAVMAGDGAGLEPLRIVPVAPALVRESMLSARVLEMRPIEAASAHPLGAAFEALATCLTSEELAVLVAPPRQELPGLMLRDRGEFAVTVPTPVEDAFELGRVRDTAAGDYGPACITARSLNEHVLVLGTPGSGKTNTCMHLLTQAHERFQVPFLAIEPAKAEYRRLEQMLGDRLRIYSVGGTNGNPLRLNPLAPIPGASLLGHIDLLKAVFNASFAMHPGMPQILEQALHEAYEDRGWNLYTGINETLGPDPSLSAAALLTPCLADLHDQIEAVMQTKGYVGEVRSNLGAALQSRLKGLMLGAKGLCLNTRRSIAPAELFERPVVLELHELRDDEEKAFVMAVVFMLLYQYSEVRQHLLPEGRREQLQHLTLIEEAHRLLADSPRSAGSEADPRGKAVALFADMLAELRALGEGFIIAEQIPTKLAPDTLKNTNLKIIHRLTAPTERAVAGQSVNLNEQQLRAMSQLSKGLAIVHGLAASASDPVGDAALVQITQVKGTLALPVVGLPSLTSRNGDDGARRHGGCEACASPCVFYPAVEPELRRSRGLGWVRIFAESALAGDAETAWRTWSQWRLERKAIGRSDGDDFCWFVHRARDWAIQVLSVRGRSVHSASRFRPADRLAAERLAAAFGQLARTWLVREEPDAQAFATLHQVLHTEFQNGRPPDLPGCTSCPARCRTFPWVVGLDLDRLSRQVVQALPRGANDAFGNALHGEQRWARVSKVLPPVEPPPGSDAPTWRRDWSYCLMTLIDLPDDVADFRESMLQAVLKEKTSPKG